MELEDMPEDVEDAEVNGNGHHYGLEGQEGPAPQGLAIGGME